MILKTALAREKFIDLKQTITEPNNKDDIVECLNCFFNFQDIDLLGFDGNTCSIALNHDPTNSIFIFKNDTGKFLYQIESASSIIHKNKLIWNCDCYMLQDLNELQNILNDLPNNDIYVNVVKNCFLKIFNCEYLPAVEEKENFKPKNVFSVGLGVVNNIENMTGATNEPYAFCTLKIKTFVNPFIVDGGTLASLDNYASSDGSYTFLFPILNGGINDASFTGRYKVGTTTYSLTDAISKYSNFIKSIEFLPFLYTGNSFTVTRNNTLTRYDCIVDLTSGTATPLGVFNNLMVLEKEELKVDFLQDGTIINSSKLPFGILAGGGARGFLRTPIANLQLDFETCSQSSNFTVAVKNDGWVLDGVFKVNVPPHYLNFYTDSSGQIFINNLTTYAQELRAIERDKDYTNYLTKINRVSNKLGRYQNLASSTTGSVASGNVTGLVTGFIDFGVNERLQPLMNNFQDNINRLNYEYALAEFNDKVSTDTLLSKMIGKNVVGDVSIMDFLKWVNGNYFKLFIETNFEQINGIWVCQKDYNYNCQNLRNTFDASFENKPFVISKTNQTIGGGFITTFFDFLKILLGYSQITYTGGNSDAFTFGRTYKLNYDVIFELIKTNNESYSKLISLPVRHI